MTRRELTAEQRAARAAKMRERWTDPAFAAKARENLARGKAKLAEKHAARHVAPATPPAGPAQDPKAAAPPPAPNRSAYGVRRWRRI